jgi:bifunctional NMN adenylyltransferase/nudix hydrolase
MKKCDYCVFIGRFQPIHKTHEAIINNALKYSNKVIILVGSSNSPRTIKNPFLGRERIDMIKRLYPDDNVTCVEIQDSPYNENQWVKKYKYLYLKLLMKVSL